MAKHMSAKQIKHFGTKRQKAALKAKRSKPKSKRHSTATRRNPPKKRATSKAHRPRTAKPRPRPRAAKKTAKKRSNPGEVILLTAGNPARKKGKKAMAKHSYKKKKKTAGAKHRSNAGRRPKHSTRTRRKGNPGSIGRPMDWVKGGIGVIAGGVGTRLAPQLLAAGSNVGVTGYAMNVAAALGLTFAAHAFTKDKVVTAAVAAGGFAALILRVVNDQSSVGKYLALSGMGDYMVSDFVTPQRLTDGLRSAQIQVPGAPAVIASSGAGPVNDTPGAGMSSYNLW